MYTNLVLFCFLVASALAELATTDETVVAESRVKKGLENPAPVEKGQTRDVNEVCRQACASLQFNREEYPRCMHSCFNYNQAFKKIESAPEKFNGNRQNRSVYKECKQKCVIRVAYKQCVESCMGGRDEKVQEETKAVDMDARQLSNVFDKCRNWCSPYLYQTSEYVNCVESCVTGNQGNRKLEDKSPADIAEAETPEVKECIKRCIAAIGPLYKHCSVRCNKSHGSDIQEMLARKAPVAFDVSPSVPQTINPVTLMKVTEPLTNILEQVFKRQQEIQRMIHGCNCAKPTPEVFPFRNCLRINN